VVAEYTYRDAALRSRPLRLVNRVGARLQALGVDRPGLSADSIVAAARKKAGHDDLGSDSYREPLDRFVAAALDEADLTTFGRLLVHRMLAGALVNRIALHAWAVEHPAVEEQRVESPWIIVGLPRTGTSLLSMLLGLDPLARPLLHWEAAHPVPPPTLAEGAEDPRIARTAHEIDGLFKLNPPLRAMHPFGATLAQECVALFMYDVRTLGLETQAHVPSYGRWLETADMTPAYAQHRLALQAFQTAQPTQRWVLKSPNHLWCLGTMLATYPDARVIWTHRDPGTVVTSLASLVNTSQRPLTSRTEPYTVAEEWKRKAKHALTTATTFDDAAPEGWCAHVHYDAFTADPIGTVTALYAGCGEKVGDLHERRMRAWLEQRGQDAFGRHRYDPADFGWTYGGLAEEFAGYTARYGIAREHA
jgi:hypothetical protein